jgi:hypothetical protein
MSNFRSPWLALFAGATLIALSVSGVFGAKPGAHTTTAPEVSTSVHHLVGDLEETTADKAETKADAPDATKVQAAKAQAFVTNDQSTKDENQTEVDANDADDANEAKDTEVEADTADDTNSNQPDSGQADTQDHNGGQQSDSSSGQNDQSDSSGD